MPYLPAINPNKNITKPIQPFPSTQQAAISSIPTQNSFT